MSPLLGFVAAVYYVFPDPVSLLILQAIAVSFSIVPLYLLTLRETGRAGLSLLVIGTYLANPGVHGLVRYDFHVEAFLPLFIFLVYYTYGGRIEWFYYLSVGLLLATIEYSAVLGLGIALSLRLEKKRLDRRIVALAVSSALLLGIVAFSSTGLMPSSWNWPSDWLTRQLLGTTTQDSQGIQGLVNLLYTGPLGVFQGVIVDFGLKILYLFLVLAPAGLATVQKLGKMIPAIPWVAILMVSSRMSYYSVDFQYSSFLIPFVYVAVIAYIKERVVQKSLVRLLVLVVVLMLLISALSPSRLILFSPSSQIAGWPSPSPLLQTIYSIRDGLPANATILTQTDIFPHLSNRAFTTINYSMPSPPQFILVNVDSPWYDWSNPSLGITRSVHAQSDLLMTSYMYQLLDSNGGLRFYRLIN